MKILKFKYYQILKRLGFKIPKYVVCQYAKSYYLKISYKNDLGMCNAIEMACFYFNIYPSFAHLNFPEFNPVFCEAESPLMSYGVFWWNVRSKEPRIKAFDKLIKYYKEHKEYI